MIQWSNIFSSKSWLEDIGKKKHQRLPRRPEELEALPLPVQAELGSSLLLCLHLWLKTLPCWTPKSLVPSGNWLHSYWTCPFFVSFPHRKWWFSIAMLDYQRVTFIPQKSSMGFGAFPSVQTESSDNFRGCPWSWMAPFNFLQQLQVNWHCSKSTYASDMDFCHLQYCWDLLVSCCWCPTIAAIFSPSHTKPRVFDHVLYISDLSKRLCPAAPY